MKDRTIWAELRNEIGNPVIVVGILAVLFVTPALILWDKIRFVPEVLVTEWMKSFAETILLVFVGRFILIIRDRRRVVVRDLDYVDERLISFLRLSGAKLAELATATAKDHQSIYAQARLGWLQSLRFITTNGFLDLKSKQLVLHYIKRTNESTVTEAIDQASRFFSETAAYEAGQVAFAISNLNTLIQEFEKQSDNGDTPTD